MEPSFLSAISLLLQFSEESGELTQAIAKLIRKERGENPTPVTMPECIHGLMEEVADVALVLDALIKHWDIDPDEVERIKQSKYSRWCERLSQ